MAKAKRIFVIGDFKSESPKSIRIQPRMWIKGLLRCGCDVQRFRYRSIMMQCVPFPSKRLALKITKRKNDQLLVEQIKKYHPDIVFVLCMKYLDAETVVRMRQVAPEAVFISRDEDPCPEADLRRIAIAKQADILISTSTGRFLQAYKNAGVPVRAFIPNVCDPDIQQRWPVGGEWKTDIIFTGKPEHTRLDRNNEQTRNVCC